MRSGRIMYLGSHLDETIVKERGLRSHNAAGSNRMKRLALALRAADFRPIIVSPATSLRAHSPSGPLLHPARVRRVNGIAVIYAPALNIVGLGALTSLFFQIVVILRVRRQNLAGAIIYNFSPGLALLALWLALERKLTLVNNIEDVSVPSLSDWSRNADARPIQQLVFWACMNIVARVSDSYVVPTKRFLDYLPRRRTETVTGCIHTPTTMSSNTPQPPLRLLYAGKIEREHGILQFADALLALDTKSAAKLVHVDVTGAGSETNKLAQKLRGLKNLNATLHGFVSSVQYGELLANAHVCVALQNPRGRYAEFKTPSKIYEFLGFGKAVIATPVGDIASLPHDTLIVIEQLDATSIANAILELVEGPDRTRSLQICAHDYARSNFSYAKVGARLSGLFESRER